MLDIFKKQPTKNAIKDDTSLAGILTLNTEWKNNRDSTIARYEGIARAKQHALEASKGLLYWGRYLSLGVIFVSAIHIWESVSRIAPASIGILHLHEYVYWGASLLFTILIDTVAVYILKSDTVLTYTGSNKSNAIWFFYILTALLNAAFVSANSPDATEALRASIQEGLGNLFLVLLPITVPVALWAVEGQNQRLEAGNIMLSVDIATLNGLIKHSTPATVTINNTNNTMVMPPGSANTIDNVLTHNTSPDRVLPLESSIGVIQPELDPMTITLSKDNCQKCGALLPANDNPRSKNMKWVGTKRHGCAVCKKS